VIFALKKTVCLIEDSRDSSVCGWRFITSAKYEMQFSAVIWSNSCWCYSLR